MANEILWTLVNTLIRVAAVQFIARLFTANVRSLTHALLVTSVLHGVATILSTCLICRPVATAWDSSVHGTCGDQVAAYVAFEIIGLLIDLAILLLPFWGLRLVQIRWQQKVGVLVTLSAGSLYGLHYLAKSSN